MKEPSGTSIKSKLARQFWASTAEEVLAQNTYKEEQNKFGINLDGGMSYPTVSPCPLSFSTRMSNNKSPDGCFNETLHQLRRPMT